MTVPTASVAVSNVRIHTKKKKKNTYKGKLEHDRPHNNFQGI
jgi:hypothetical protein